VFTGHEPSSPLDVMFAPEAKELRVWPVDSAEFEKRWEDLQAFMTAVREKVQQVAVREPDKRPGEQEVDFGVGDYVLTASESADKLHPRWEGPAQVMEVINPRRFKVRNLVTEEITEWHAECLKRYADKDLKVTEQLKEFAAHGGRGYIVSAILDHRWEAAAKLWELKVLWEGYPREEATWEPFTTLAQDVPLRVRAYVNSMPDEAEKDELLALLDGRRLVRKRARGRV
jgi:hypothetical protein